MAKPATPSLDDLVHEQVNALFDVRAPLAVMLDGWQAEPGETEIDAFRRRVVQQVDERLEAVISALS